MKNVIFLNRRLLVLLLLAIFTLTGCGASGLQIKANYALQTKRYDEALAIYQEILKSDPANMEALKGVGETYLRMKKGPEAAAALERAYAKSPDQQTIFNLGLAYSEAGDYGKAISTWDVFLASETNKNLADLVKKHQTLALYKDASLQAKKALVQERTLISESVVAEKRKASVPVLKETIRKEPSSKYSKPSDKTKRSRTVRKEKVAIPEKSEPEQNAAVLAEQKLKKDFPVDERTIAVSLFGENGKTEKTKHLRKALASMIITDLSKAPDIKVVERVRMQKLLDELNLGQSGIVDPATSPRVGRLLKAGKVVSGSMLGANDESIRILRILMNVSTGRTLGDQDAQGKVDEFFKLQKAIVLGIIKDLGIKLSPRDEELISRYATHNYKGLLLYGEGLDWQDMGEWDKAVHVFKQCVIIDPAGPCGPALSAAPSASDEAIGPEGILEAVSMAVAENQAAAAAASGSGGGGGH